MFAPRCDVCRANKMQMPTEKEDEDSPDMHEAQLLIQAEVRSRVCIVLAISHCLSTASPAVHLGGWQTVRRCFVCSHYAQLESAARIIHHALATCEPRAVALPLILQFEALQLRESAPGEASSADQASN